MNQDISDLIDGLVGKFEALMTTNTSDVAPDYLREILRQQYYNMIKFVPQPMRMTATKLYFQALVETDKKITATYLRDTFTKEQRGDDDHDTGTR